MSVHRLKDVEEVPVTPSHSSAVGQLVTGERIELAVLRYRRGEGAEEHAHPQEQMLLVLSGRIRMRIGSETHELGPREVAHMPPDVPHSLSVLEDAEVVSAKSLVGGIGHPLD